MLVDQILRVAPSARRFGQPHHRHPLDLAALLERGELDIEGAELVDLVGRDLEAVFVEVGEAFELVIGHVEQAAQLLDRELFGLLIFETDAAFDHFIEAERVFRLEAIHYLRLEAGIDLAVAQYLDQLLGDAVMEEAVLFEAFVARAEELDAPLEALVALPDGDDRDRAHKAQQRALDTLIALVRALERGFGDAVDDRLADPIPGIGDQQVVDAPIG